MVLAHGGDPSRVHACVSLADGSVRITQDPNDTCTSGNSPVDWNIESAPGGPGPAGFQGLTGPQGPPGPPGRAGADSRLALRSVTAASPSLRTRTRALEARCHRAEFAVSGAWRVESGSGTGDFLPLESRPLGDGRGWLVRVDGRHASRAWRLIVKAQCAPERRQP
jgi:hypothetical protein